LAEEKAARQSAE
jgi:hypothetical protein